MNFLQTVFTRVLLLSDCKATYTLKLQKLLSSIRKESAQKKILVDKLLLHYFEDICHSQVTNHSPSQRSLQSKVGGFTRNVDVQVA